jgi:hypothetical protein
MDKFADFMYLRVEIGDGVRYLADELRVTVAGA